MDGESWRKICSTLIFTASDTKPIALSPVWLEMRRHAALPDVRLHDLRHSFASFLVNAGRSLYEVQELLGHADIRTTSRYAHLSRERLIAAVEVVPQVPIELRVKPS